MNPPGWLIDRLPEWARSIRFRYTLLYSGVLFGVAAVVVAAIYLVLMMHLRNQPYTTGARSIHEPEGPGAPAGVRGTRRRGSGNPARVPR